MKRDILVSVLRLGWPLIDLIIGAWWVTCLVGRDGGHVFGR
jgi:hypothetical protein